MPWKSEAQQRKMHSMVGKPGGMSAAKVHEFDEATKGRFKDLPEHVTKPKGKRPKRK